MWSGVTCASFNLIANTPVSMDKFVKDVNCDGSIDLLFFITLVGISPTHLAFDVYSVYVDDYNSFLCWCFCKLKSCFLMQCCDFFGIILECVEGSYGTSLPILTATV